MKHKYKVGDIVYYFSNLMNACDFKRNFILKLKVVKIEGFHDLLCSIVNIKEYCEIFNIKKPMKAKDLGTLSMDIATVFPIYEEAKEFAINVLEKQIEKRINEKYILEKMLSKYIEK